jgi:hypothetical protein
MPDPDADRLAMTGEDLRHDDDEEEQAAGSVGG